MNDASSLKEVTCGAFAQSGGSVAAADRGRALNPMSVKGRGESQMSGWCKPPERGEMAGLCLGQVLQTGSGLFVYAEGRGE